MSGIVLAFAPVMVEPGTLQLPLRVGFTLATSLHLGSVQCSLTYAKTRIRVLSFTYGPLLSGAVNNETLGLLRFNALHAEGIRTGQVLGTAWLEVLAAYGNTSLTLKVESAADEIAIPTIVKPVSLTLCVTRRAA